MNPQHTSMRHPPLASPSTPDLGKWVRELALPRWTVAFFLLTIAAALSVPLAGMPATATMAPPFVLLGLNLGAAIIVHGRFRADLPLLIFHLALLALVLLFVLSRLTYLDAHATVTRGTEFDGHLMDEERGPLHGDGVGRLRFVNDGFADNAYNSAYRTTRNRVSWQDDAGAWHATEIGEDRPLVMGGYRIYPSHRRGYTPLFRWQPQTGAAEHGAVQIEYIENTVPPPPGVETFSNSAKWTLPDGSAASAILVLEQVPARGERSANLDTHAVAHRLIVQVAGRQEEMRPGDTIALGAGRLTYVRLDSWMGYHIAYDPTQPWLVATILLGVGSLIWFYARRLAMGPAEAEQ